MYYVQRPAYRAYVGLTDTAGGDFISKFHDQMKPMAIPLIIGGAIGLLGRPPFSFQDKGLFHILFKGGAAAGIAIGLWAMFT